MLSFELSSGIFLNVHSLAMVHSTRQQAGEYHSQMIDF